MAGLGLAGRSAARHGKTTQGQFKAEDTMRTISEAHEDTLKLEEYLSRQPNGAELSYLAIEAETGVEMNSRGKQFLRSALRMSKREYETTYGYGIKLAAADNALRIIDTRFMKIDKAVRRGHKTQRTIQQSEYMKQLTPEEQSKVFFAGAVFGAIRIAADQSRELRRKKPLVHGSSLTLSIPVPEIN